jgi:hypothetical protein
LLFTAIGNLKIGDYITLKSVKFENYLCSEGILNTDLFLNDGSLPFDSQVFCVHLQRQYSASRELEEFVSVHGDDPKKIDDVDLQKYLGSLQVQ